MSLYCPILMYHHVGAARPGEKERNAVPVGTFREQLGCLAEGGFQGVSIDRLSAALRGEPGAGLPERPAAISFDDADARRLGPALEVLSALGFPAAGYLIAGRPEDFPAPAEAEGMRAAGFIFGSHGLSHGRLTGLPGEESRREIFESKRVIEERLGAPVAHLAYPHGAFGPREERLAREAGYLTALSTRRGNRHGRGELFRLRRLAMRPYTTPRRLRRYLGLAWHLQHSMKEALGLEGRGGARGE